LDLVNTRYHGRATPLFGKKGALHTKQPDFYWISLEPPHFPPQPPHAAQAAVLGSKISEKSRVFPVVVRVLSGFCPGKSGRFGNMVNKENSRLSAFPVVLNKFPIVVSKFPGVLVRKWQSS